jgi:hypothetical protein
MVKGRMLHYHGWFRSCLESSIRPHSSRHLLELINLSITKYLYSVCRMQCLWIRIGRDWTVEDVFSANCPKHESERMRKSTILLSIFILRIKNLCRFSSRIFQVMWLYREQSKCSFISWSRYNNGDFEVTIVAFFIKVQHSSHLRTIEQGASICLSYSRSKTHAWIIPNHAYLGLPACESKKVPWLKNYHSSEINVVAGITVDSTFMGQVKPYQLKPRLSNYDSLVL